MKIKEFCYKVFKSDFVKMVIFFLIGVVTSVFVMFFYLQQEQNDIFNAAEGYLANEYQEQQFIDDNKDYLFAGMMLKTDFRENSEQFYHENNINEMSYENYLSSIINPIYIQNIQQKMLEIDTSSISIGLKEFLTKYITEKKTVIISYITEQMTKLLTDNSETIVNFITEKLMNYVTENKTVIISYFTEQMTKLLADNSETIVNFITEKLMNYLNESEQINSLSNEIKNYITNNQEVIFNKVKEYIMENKNRIISQLNEIIDAYLESGITAAKEKARDIIAPYLEKLNNYLLELEVTKEQITQLMAEINLKIENIESLFVDEDADYHFNDVVIDDQIFPLSFLNFIDLYIDPDTIVLDNNGTLINVGDDKLVIKDIYLNFESLDGNGIDIVLGKIEITGSKAIVLYSLIGVINETI